MLERKGLKVYKMTLNGKNFCNPTAENIVKEMLLGLKILFKDVEGLDVHSIELYETPNCSVDVWVNEIEFEEEINFNYQMEPNVLQFKNLVKI